MIPILPIAYLCTEEAIDDFLGRDEEFCRLKAAWEGAAGEVQMKALNVAAERQNELVSFVLAAVVARVLAPIVLKQTPQGSWGEFAPKHSFWTEPMADHALLRGKLFSFGSEIDDAVLCFRRQDWSSWLETCVTSPPRGPEVDAAEKSVTTQVANLKSKPTLPDVIAWYTDRVAAHIPGQLPPDRDEDLAAAHDHFQTRGLKEWVRIARRKTAPPEWKKPGARGRKVAASTIKR